MVGKRRKLELKGNIIRYAYNRDIDQLRPLTCAVASLDLCLESEIESPTLF